jgi:hypothetical protein
MNKPDPTLTFNPSFEQTAKTGVDTIVRKGDVYTLRNVDGSTESAKLTSPDDSDVMAIIKVVKALSSEPA